MRRHASNALPVRLSAAFSARHLAAILFLLLAASDGAAAHELGADRFTTPIPLSTLFIGAGATVALTALLLGRAGITVPEMERDRIELPATAVRALSQLGRILFAAVVLVAVYRGLVGRQVAAENVATLFVWPVWLKGVGVVAILVGSPWRTLSPWRGIHALLERHEGNSLGTRPYPDRLGYWPAVVGFVLAVGILETLTVVPQTPSTTAGLVALYAALMSAGGVVFGRAWFRNADFIEVLYRQFTRVAPLHVHQSTPERHVVELRYPWQGCRPPITGPGGVSFVVAMVYTVSFDGFTNTPEYQSLQFTITDAIGTGLPVEILVYLVGLALFVASFECAMVLVDWRGTSEAESDGIRRWGGGGVRGAAMAFAPTVIPITAAYELAHNYPFVLQNLARLVELALQAGGAASPRVSFLGWLTVQLFWASQVLLIVAGHVVAVIAAHAVAVGRYGSLGRARRAHLPHVVVMVGYTVLSLWIISRPVVSG